VQLPVMPPVAPMLAKLVSDIPPGQFYEPKWDGFRAIVFRDGNEVEIGSRNERPMTRYFPEVVVAVKDNLPPRCVVDGEFVVVRRDGQGLDFWALQQRIHPAESRVRLLSERTPASFIAFDLLAIDNADCTSLEFRDRRGQLERALASAGRPVHITPITRDRRLASRWFNLFEGAGVDGLIAKKTTQTYQQNKRVMAKIKHQRTADCVVAGYRVHKAVRDAIGSLLLGLYDDSGALIPVGVVGAFPMIKRKSLFVEMQSLVTDLAEHPWRWAEAEAALRGRGGEVSRWNPDKDLSFVPLRPERVIEVRYDYMEGPRFRHTTQFVRWRPDRAPASCGYDQLARPARLDFKEVLAGRVT
jgi:ATP-dependent DNA ligase